MALIMSLWQLESFLFHFFLMCQIFRPYDICFVSNGLRFELCQAILLHLQIIIRGHVNMEMVNYVFNSISSQTHVHGVTLTLRFKHVVCGIQKRLG